MIVREFLGRFEPYEWEPSTERVSSILNINPKKIVRLDMNTSPYRPSKLLWLLADKLSRINVNHYPDASYGALRTALSEYNGLHPEQFVITCGADEGIDITSKVFVDPGTEAIISHPSYSYFRIPVEILGGRVVSIRRKQGVDDNLDGILRASSPKTRLVFLCSPNNPTGNTCKRETVVRLLAETDAAVVVDEAYFEFCGKTFAGLTEQYDNLIIVRTLSKAFGLAGARVGYIISSTKTAKQLNKVRPPNSLGVLSLALAEMALRDPDIVMRTVKRVIGERERCVRSLRGISNFRVYPSEANFLLLEFLRPSASKVYKMLLKRGIVLRDLTGTPGLEECLRLTVGLPEHNDAAINAIKECMLI